jgi:chorismate synthase
MGEPLFDKTSSILSHILFSIPSVKGVFFGDEIFSILLPGSKYVDEIISMDGATITNRSGGLNGGITNGNDLVINCLIRPISSFRKKQNLYNIDKNEVEETEVMGRHDLFHSRRIMVVLESAIKIGLADLILANKAKEV